jgi:Icc-related predicted phosphoesterase
MAPPMRLLFLADLHFTLKQFDWLLARAGEYDLVVIGGDLLDLGAALDIDTQIPVVEKYLALLLRKNIPLVVSSGNHDGDSRNAGDESIAQWIQDVRGAGLHVDGDSFEWGGHLVSVCPWWDGDVSRAQLEAQLERDAARPRQRWIWIHHAPPTRVRTSWTGRQDAGDNSLRGWIERFRPDFVLSGHIHNAPFVDDGSWIDRLGSTWVFNTGRQIGGKPTWLVLDPDGMTAEWSSIYRSDPDLRQLGS